MKKKILFSPLIIIILIIVFGVGIAGAAILISGSGGTENVNLQKGLVGHWKLDGNAKDSTPYGNTGTVTGAILTTDRKGQLSKAYSLDGSNDAVDAGTGTSLDLGSGDITLSAWIYLDAYNNQGSLWNAIVMDGELVDVPGPFYGFATDSSLKIYFGARDIDTNAVSNSAVNGKWVHAVGVRASDVLTLYIDGVLQTDTGAGSGTVSNAVPLYFGRDNITSRYFDGSIDDVRIYNRALSATEVTALYQEYDPGIVVSDLQKGLVGNWKLDGNAKDSTPYGNNGTVTEATLTTDRKGQVNKAYNFDGIDDYISVGTPAISTNGPATLSGWFYFTQDANAKDDYNNLFSRGTGISMLFQHPANNYFYTEGGYFIYVPPLNQWLHIVLTYSGQTSTALLYVNGVLKTINVQTESNITVFDKISSATGVGRKYAFSGSIDDVRVYNRALSATEVTALYQEYDPGIVVSDLQKGLVGNWKLDGNAKDSTPYGNNGTVTEATLTTDRKGQVNKAYNFDGTNDYVDVGSGASLNITGPVSVEAWVYLNSFCGVGYHPVQSGNDYGMEVIGSTHEMAFWINDGGWKNSKTTNAVPLNTWKHYVGVYDGSQIKIYEDGAQTGTPTSSGNPVSLSQSIKIGWNPAGTDCARYWPGLIDDVRIYNRALSATEITALYQSY